MNSTQAVATFAIDLIPPKIINASRIAKPIAATHGLTLKAFVIELAIALDWTPGSNNPTDITVTTAKMSP